jgi:hypothetical protein
MRSGGCSVRRWWWAAKDRQAAARARVQRGDVGPDDLPNGVRLVAGFCFFGTCPVAGIYGIYLGLREGSAFWALLGASMVVGGTWVLVKLIGAHIQIRRVVRERYRGGRGQ